MASLSIYTYQLKSGDNQSESKKVMQGVGQCIMHKTRMHACAWHVQSCSLQTHADLGLTMHPHSPLAYTSLLGASIGGGEPLRVCL